MAKIISERQRVVETTHYQNYRWNNNSGGGFSFPCNTNGGLLLDNEGAIENYVGCISGEYDVTYEGIQSFTNSYTVDAVLECSCGEHVSLSSFTNTCDECEADYNMSGQRLADRSQWGEETGEHWSEVY